MTSFAEYLDDKVGSDREFEETMRALGIDPVTRQRIPPQLSPEMIDKQRQELEASNAEEVAAKKKAEDDAKPGPIDVGVESMKKTLQGQATFVKRIPAIGASAMASAADTIATSIDELAAFANQHVPGWRTVIGAPPTVADPGPLKAATQKLKEHIDKVMPMRNGPETLLRDTTAILAPIIALQGWMAAGEAAAAPGLVTNLATKAGSVIGSATSKVPAVGRAAAGVAETAATVGKWASAFGLASGAVGDVTVVDADSPYFHEMVRSWLGGQPPDVRDVSEAYIKGKYTDDEYAAELDRRMKRRGIHAVEGAALTFIAVAGLKLGGKLINRAMEAWAHSGADVAKTERVVIDVPLPLNRTSEDAAAKVADAVANPPTTKQAADAALDATAGEAKLTKEQIAARNAKATAQASGDVAEGIAPAKMSKADAEATSFASESVATSITAPTALDDAINATNVDAAAALHKTMTAKFVEVAETLQPRERMYFERFAQDVRDVFPVEGIHPLTETQAKIANKLADEIASGLRAPDVEAVAGKVSDVAVNGAANVNHEAVLDAVRKSGIPKALAIAAVTGTGVFAAVEGTQPAEAGVASKVAEPLAEIVSKVKGRLPQIIDEERAALAADRVRTKAAPKLSRIDKAAKTFLDNVKDAKDLDEAFEMMSGSVGNTKRISFEDLTKVYERFGVDTKMLSKMSGDSRPIERLVYGAADMATRAATEMHEAIAVYRKTGDETAKQTIIQRIGIAAEAYARLSGTESSMGRGLRIVREMHNGELAFMKQLQQRLPSAMVEGKLNFDQLVEILDDMSPEWVARTASKIADPTWQGDLRSFWIAAKLSSPWTLFKTTAGQTAMLAYSVPEKLVTAGIAKATGGEQSFRSVGAWTTALFDGWVDGIHAATNARQTGVPLRATNRWEAPRPSIRPETYGVDPNSYLGRGIGFVGWAAEQPGQNLETIDNVFLSVTKGGAMREYARMKAGTDDAMYAALMKNPTDDMIKYADKAGQMYTLTNAIADPEAADKALRRGALYLEQLKSTHPNATYLFPFLRSRTNAATYLYERTPIIGAMNAKFVADVRAGGNQAAEALGKQATATMMLATLGYFATQGSITGDGPSDPKLREAWLAGNKPNWIKLPGGIEFGYDPDDGVGAIVHLAATLGEAATSSETYEETVSKMATALTDTLSHAAVVQALAPFIDALRGGVSKDSFHGVAKLTTDVVAGFIPAVATDLRRALDPLKRDTTVKSDRTTFRDELEYLRKRLLDRLPGWSKSLKPALSAFGQEIQYGWGWSPDNTEETARVGDPVYMATAKASRVANELVKQGVVLTKPGRVVDGVELDDETYYDYVKLSTQSKRYGGKNLEEALAYVMEKPIYKRYVDGPDGGKAAMLKSVIMAYHKAGLNELRWNNPDIQQAVRERRQKRRAIVEE